VLNLSPEKVLLVLVIALVVLGPSRLPEAARTLGRLVGNLRRLSGTLQAEVHNVISEPTDALRGSAGGLGLGEVRDALREMANPLAPPVSAASRPAATGSPYPQPPPALGPPAPDDPNLN
jgi:hypothetical protein